MFAPPKDEPFIKMSDRPRPIKPPPNTAPSQTGTLKEGSQTSKLVTKESKDTEMIVDRVKLQPIRSKEKR